MNSDAISVDELLRFIGDVFDEREKLETALIADSLDIGLQVNLRAWRSAGHGAPPESHTRRVVDELAPSSGRRSRPLRDSYLRALNEAIRGGQQALIQSLRESYEQTTRTYQTALEACERSSRAIEGDNLNALLFLLDFSNAVEMGSNDDSNQDDGDRYRGWPKQSEVADQLGMKDQRYRITRLIDAGELRTNNKQGHQCRVDPASVLDYCNRKGISYGVE